MWWCPNFLLWTSNSYFLPLILKWLPVDFFSFIRDNLELIMFLTDLDYCNLTNTKGIRKVDRRVHIEHFSKMMSSWFLAVMSSSRSDNVTLSVRPSVRSFVRPSVTKLLFYEFCHVNVRWRNSIRYITRLFKLTNEY